MAAEVKAALGFLYGADNAARKQADEFLGRFQSTPAAWQVADAMLSMEPAGGAAAGFDAAEAAALFFGAQTLHCKIRYDFDELPAAQWPSLRASLLRHLCRHHAIGSPRNVQTRIALAVAALAAQSTWNDVLAECHAGLVAAAAAFAGAGAGQGGVAAAAAAAAVADPMPCFVEVMTHLPSEALHAGVRISDAARDAFVGVLRALVPTVLASLCDAWAAPGCRSAATQQGILRCFKCWVSEVGAQQPRGGPGGATVLSGAALGACPLLRAAFEAVLAPQLADEAADAVVSVLRAYPYVPARQLEEGEEVEGAVAQAAAGGGMQQQQQQTLPARNAELAQVVVPLVMALQPAWRRAVATEDDDGAASLCRVFVETGEAYLDLLMCEEDVGLGALVALVGECTAHGEAEVSAVTFHFWYMASGRLAAARDFSRAVQRGGGGGGGGPSAAGAAAAARFGAPFGALVQQLLQKLALPDGFSAADATEQAELLKFREEVSDCLFDAAQAMGPANCVRGICGVLSAAMGGNGNGNPAQAAESRAAAGACFVGLRAVMRQFLKEACLEEKADRGAGPAAAARAELDKTLDALLTQLPAMAALAGGWPPHLRSSATLLVGSCANWLALPGGGGGGVAPPNRPARLLSPLLGFAIGGLADGAVAIDAAQTICKLCTGCARHLGPQLMGVLAPHVAAAPGQGFLRADDKLHLLEGLCRVVSDMDAAQAAAAAPGTEVAPAEALALRGRALAELVSPIGAALQQQVAAAAAVPVGGAGADAAAGEVAAVLKRLAKVFEKTNFEPDLRRAAEHAGAGGGGGAPPVNPLEPFFAQLLPMLAAVMATPRVLANWQVAESLCNVIKHATRGLGRRAMRSSLPKLAELIAGGFGATAHSPYLYAAAVVVGEFRASDGGAAAGGEASEAEEAALLAQLLVQLFEVRRPCVLPSLSLLSFLSFLAWWWWQRRRRCRRRRQQQHHHSSPITPGPIDDDITLLTPLC